MKLSRLEIEILKSLIASAIESGVAPWDEVDGSPAPLTVEDSDLLMRIYNKLDGVLCDEELE